MPKFHSDDHRFGIELEASTRFSKGSEGGGKVAAIKTVVLYRFIEKSEDEVRNILEKRLDDYRFELKKHGIKTKLAGATSILSFPASAAAAQLLTSSPLLAAAGGIALASGIAAWVASTLIDKASIERDEVAYIYEATKLN